MTYRELYRDALGTDPALQELVDASLDRQAERLFGLLAPTLFSAVASATRAGSPDAS
jgi:hypothetical protein